MHTSPITTKRFALASAAMMLLSLLTPFGSAHAASLVETYVRLDRIQAAETTSVRVVFKTSSTNGTEAKVKVDFTGFTVNATQSITTAACATETGATALPTSSSLSAAGSGTVVTVTNVSDLATSTKYCFDLTSTSAVTNPSAGVYYPTVSTTTSGDAPIDSVEIASRIIANDQITITAVVPPSFNFVLDGNTDSFTTDLSDSSVAITNGRTVTVNTNAKTGWIAWAKDSDANLGLRSAAASKTILSSSVGTVTQLSAGTEGYVWGVTAVTQGTGAGTTSPDTAFNATGANHGSGLDGTLRPVASSTGTALNAIITLKARAAISSLTPAAADYTDTITVVGAGNF